MNKYQKEYVLGMGVEQLNVAIAERLGWSIYPPTGLIAIYSPQEHFMAYTSFPNWPTDIAKAFELDGDGWYWTFDEYPDYLEVQVYTMPDGTLSQELSIHCELWTEDKMSTYALARCRAWLLATLFLEEDEDS